jgi:flagellar hook-length control protein FliK
MNLNLLTIDALSTTPAQPLRRMASKADGLGEDSTQLAFGMEDAAANKQSKRLTAASSTNVEDTPQSYNTDIATQAADKEVSNRGFENVLKQRLVLDESGDESGDGKVAAKPKESVADDKKEQAFTLTEFQSVPCALAKADNLSSIETQAAGGNIGDVQRSVSQQTQVTSAGGSQTVPSAAAQTMGTQQGQQPSEASPSTDTGQVAGNSVAASPRSADNTVKMNVAENPPRAESDKPVESANQQHRGIDSETFGLNNQPATVESKARIATSTAATLTGGSDSKQVVASIVSEGRQNSKGGAQNEHNKNELSGDGHRNTQNLSQTISDSGQDAGQLTEKLNVEKADVIFGKTITLKPEPAGETSQSTAGQVSTLDVAQVAAGNRPVVADRSTTTASNGSTADTAAAIREQVCQSVAASIQQGNSQITIHLNPPELGRVSVKFSERGNELTGQLEVTNSQTRAEIQQAIPEIIRSLQESGITVKSIDVTLSDSSRQPAQESFRDNSSQDIWQQFGSQGFQDTGGNQSSPNSFVTPTYSQNGSAVGNDTSSSRNQSSPSDSSDNLLDVLI